MTSEADLFYADQARRLHDSVAEQLPYTLRHGKVLCTIRAVDVDGFKFSVLDADASYDGVPVPLDLPLHYVNALAVNPLSPLLDVAEIIASTVRRLAEPPDEAAG